MIIPARWYAGGKGLDAFRATMLSDERIRILHDFENASDCFTGVEIKGGVCYFLWDREYSGECKVITHEKDKILSVMTRNLLEKNCDIFIRYNEAIEILRKVQNNNEVSINQKISARSYILLVGVDVLQDPCPCAHAGRRHESVVADAIAVIL